MMITKVNADTWRICLLEVVWKMAETVIDTRIKKVVQFHYVLHGFHTGRAEGTAIMEIKLAHELAMCTRIHYYY